MSSIIGSVELFSFDFVPEGWLACQGQTLNDSNYMNLYSLIAFTYGGEGRSFFKLPDLRGKSPLPQMQYCICYEGTMPVRPTS